MFNSSQDGRNDRVKIPRLALAQSIFEPIGGMRELPVGSRRDTGGGPP